MRRDEQTVGTLAELLTGTDRAAADAAAAALSRIGTPQAVDALKTSLGKVPAAAEGLLHCAESAPVDQAAALCELLLNASLPPSLQVAAMRRAVLARGNDGLPLLLQQLEQKDLFLFNGALRTAVELPGTPEVSRALIAELAKLPDERQPRLIAVLAERGDTAAGTALLERAKAGKSPVVVAAIHALARLECVEAIPVFAAQVTSPDKSVANAALSAWAGFPGKVADNAVLALLNHSATNQRNAGIRLAAQRRLAAAVPAALRLAANNSDSESRNGSLRLLKDLADGKDVSALLDLLQKAPDPEIIAEVLNTVWLRQTAAKAKKNEKADSSSGVVPQAMSAAIFSAYEKTEGAPKRALIRTLALIGDDPAFGLVHAATTDADAELRETALRTLCEWPTEKALPDLERLTTGADSPKFRILALRGYIRLTVSQNAPLAEKAPL